MIVGSGGGYVICGFFGEDLGILSIFCREGFLWFLSFSFHSEVGGHGELVNCGICGRSQELGTTLSDVVDDIGVHSAFRELFWGFCAKVLAKAGLFGGAQSGFLARVYLGGI